MKDIIKNIESMVKSLGYFYEQQAPKEILLVHIDLIKADIRRLEQNINSGQFYCMPKSIFDNEYTV